MCVFACKRVGEGGTHKAWYVFSTGLVPTPLKHTHTIYGHKLVDMQPVLTTELYVNISTGVLSVNRVACWNGKGWLFVKPMMLVC